MFWNRFYELCIKHNTKPNPVAKNIGISSGSLTKWKNDNVLPNGETLIKIADYLNCSVDYLLGRTDSPDLASAAQPADAQYEPEAAALFSRILRLDEPDRARISERVDILLEDDKYSSQDAASLPA